MLNDLIAESSDLVSEEFLFVALALDCCLHAQW